MNLLCDISTFNLNHLFFLDTKKNMVIDGKFTKLVYSDSMVSLNGLYLYCPIEILHSHISQTSYEYDKVLKGTQQGSTIEHTRKVRSTFGDTLKRTTEGSSEEHRFNRYTNEQGYTILTKKIPILFSILNPTNIQIMKELNHIEHEILEYYNEYFKINKVNVYSLRNQLKNGNIRVVHKVNGDHASDTKNYHDQRPLVVKISGIWETDMNVGITFKFQR